MVHVQLKDVFRLHTLLHDLPEEDLTKALLHLVVRKEHDEANPTVLSRLITLDVPDH